MSKLCGIYLIRHLESGKSYVGQSVDITRRWAGHCVPSAAKRGHLGAALAKYGRTAFSFQILEECTPAQLDAREIAWLAEIDCMHPQGYNLMAAGQSNGRRSHEDSRKKLSESTHAYLARIGRDGFCASRGFDEKHSFTHTDGRTVVATCSDMRHLHGCAKPSYLVTRVRNISDGWVLTERAEEVLLRRHYQHKDGRQVFATVAEMQALHGADHHISSLGPKQKSCKGWSLASQPETVEG